MSIEHNGQKWTIKRTKDPIGGDRKNRAILGSSDEAENLIIFDGTLPKTRQEEVLLHELMHVANWNAPEFMVSDTGRGLHGLLSVNKIMRPNWLETIVDGTATKAEADLVNEQNKEVQEAAPIFLMREVDEGPWGGDGISQNGDLDIAIGDKINRSACRRAEAAILQGNTKLKPQTYRKAIRELVTIFRDVLNEEPHPALVTIARG